MLNKVDILDQLGRRRLAHAFPRALQISAGTGEGLDALAARIAELFSDRFEDVRLLVPYEDGRVLAQLSASAARSPSGGTRPRESESAPAYPAARSPASLRISSRTRSTRRHRPSDRGRSPPPAGRRRPAPAGVRGRRGPRSGRVREDPAPARRASECPHRARGRDSRRVRGVVQPRSGWLPVTASESSTPRASSTPAIAVRLRRPAQHRSNGAVHGGAWSEDRAARRGTGGRRPSLRSTSSPRASAGPAASDPRPAEACSSRASACRR